MYFHFPRGKVELAAAAVDLYAERATAHMRRHLAEHDTVRDAVVAIFDAYVEHLDRTDYVEGCAVASVALDAAAAHEELADATGRAFRGGSACSPRPSRPRDARPPRPTGWPRWSSPPSRARCHGQGHAVDRARRHGPRPTAHHPRPRVAPDRTYVRYSRPMTALRWDQVDEPQPQQTLFDEPVFEREPGRGEFRGIEFLHVRAQRIINEVKGAPFGFRYTINAYRGCSHACTYCFARPTHAYLDLDADRDFERRIVVKVNAVSLLRSELDPRRWAGDLIAMGTNTDPYQRAEGKYRLTRGIVEVLTEAANPFSILTKSTLVLRDLDAPGRGGPAHRGAGQPVDRHARRGRVARHRARHAPSRPPGAGGRGAQRRRRAVRRAHRAGAARAVRRARAARRGGAGLRRRRRPVDLDRAAAPAAGRQGGVTCPGWPRPTPTSWPTTGAATATAPTPPRPTSAALATRGVRASCAATAARPAERDDPEHMVRPPASRHRRGRQVAPAPAATRRRAVAALRPSTACSEAPQRRGGRRCRRGRTTRPPAPPP